MQQERLGPRRVAIMQPYVFPYMGYFSLVNKVDHFVFLDNVNFPKKGWVNRNILVINGKPTFFTIPLDRPSQNKLINEIKTSGGADFAIKFRKTIEINFRKYPYFDDVFQIIDQCLPVIDTEISNIAMRSVCLISKYLRFNTTFSVASEEFSESGLAGADRIIDLCIQAGGKYYVNAEGGRHLYEHQEFLNHGVHLEFDRYSQNKCFNFFKNAGHVVSSIDTLMRFSPDEIRTKLNDEVP